MTMPAMVRKLMFLRDAGIGVKRSHTARVRAQNLSEHQHQVAEIILAVRPAASAALIVAALRHDVYENVTGDSPATAKWLSADLRTALNNMEVGLNDMWRLVPGLCDDDQLLLKWADMCEFVLFCLDELKGGNRWALPGLHAGMGAFQDLAVAQDDVINAVTIYNYIKEEYQQWLTI